MLEEKNKEQKAKNNQSNLPELTPDQIKTFEANGEEVVKGTGGEGEDFEEAASNDILEAGKPAQEKIVYGQSAQELENKVAGSADGITTDADYKKEEADQKDGSVEEDEPVQGVISQEEAIAALKENRQLKTKLKQLTAKHEA